MSAASVAYAPATRRSVSPDRMYRDASGTAASGYARSRAACSCTPAANSTAARTAVATTAVEDCGFTLLEIPPGKNQPGDRQQHGDVHRGIGGGHRDVADRHGQAVHHVALDVELRQVREHPVEAAGEARGHRRIDHLLEIPEVAAEVTDDI